MHRRLLIVFLTLLISFVAFGQNSSYTIPDYGEIEKLTKDKSSLFYYQDLFKRYHDYDTTLTLRDYRMLYYGYFFQPDYTAFYKTAEADSMKTILNKEDLTQADWKDIVRMGNTNLDKNPFDLKGLNIVWIAYRQTDDSARAALYFDKLKKLVQIILSSGDGLSESTAFHVLNISHEYDIVHILGYEFGGNQKLTEAKCDYLSLKTNNDQLPGLYFDVKQIFKGYERTLSSKAP